VAPANAGLHADIQRKLRSDCKGFDAKLRLLSKGWYERASRKNLADREEAAEKAQLGVYYGDEKQCAVWRTRRGDLDTWHRVDRKDEKLMEPSKDQQSLFDAEVDLVRNAMRGAVGKTLLRARLTLTGVTAATVTTGVVTKVITIDPSVYGEWSAFAGIFDEYRVDAAHLDFTTTNTMANAVVADSMRVVCYDPASATGLSNVQQGTDFEQHKLFSNGSLASVDVSLVQGKPMSFHCKIPNGVLTNGTSGPVSVGGSNWCPTAVPLPYGYIKSYYIGAVVTATAVDSWCVSVDVSFRMRF